MPVTLKHLYLLVLPLIQLPPLSHLLPLHRQLCEVLLGVMGRCSGELDVSGDEVFRAVEAHVRTFEAVLFMVKDGFVQAGHEMGLPRVRLLTILNDLFY